LTFCKNVFVVFLNSPYRETPKNVLRKKSIGRWVWDLADAQARGGASKKNAGPSTKTKTETKTPRTKAKAGTGLAPGSWGLGPDFS
jgi:hypothetical protein